VQSAHLNFRNWQKFKLFLMMRQSKKLIAKGKKLCVHPLLTNKNKYTLYFIILLLGGGFWGNTLETHCEIKGTY